MRERWGRRAIAENEQRRTRAKVWAAEIDAARRRAGFMLPAGLADRAAWLGWLLSQWAIVEVAPGRLLLWLPVAFGFGIVAYFTADREPAWWAASALTLAGVIVTILVAVLQVIWPALAQAISTPGVEAALQTVITAAAVFISPPNTAN